jgi:hypothetical protein
LATRMAKMRSCLEISSRSTISETSFLVRIKMSGFL